ncbi:hypothetical protein [Streptomyces sp. NBC_01264]|uniref:hypothetical protein n=1 Tax=Streptomyces sp. NBC_01264 TaxID=2903804 RepID=UPI00225C0ADA|nr:hypothetical protein [Streptomyces sp. NBC_01264]MCX4778053.1 hypothetical protein [Streptomyces sp. NBC_01264]
MDTVSQVLGWSVAAGGGALLLTLLAIIGGRDEFKEMRELDETGVEVQAVLVALEPLADADGLRVSYEYPAADGSTARHTADVGPNPLYVVGETYALVRLPGPAMTVHMGTMSAVRKERAEHEAFLRAAVWTVIAAIAMCAAAVTGLALMP